MKILKLISFIMILLGPVINGSVWAAAHSGVGHTVGNNHYAAGYQLSVKSQVNSGHPHVNSLQIARRGGRSGGSRHIGRSGVRHRSIGQSSAQGGSVRHIGRSGVRHRSIGQSINRNTRNVTSRRNFDANRNISHSTSYRNYRNAKSDIRSFTGSTRQIGLSKKISTTQLARRGSRGGVRSGGISRGDGRGISGNRGFRGGRGFSGNHVFRGSGHRHFGRGFRGGGHRHFGRGFRGGGHRHFGRGFRGGGHRHYGRGYFNRWWPFYGFGLGYGLGYGYSGYWPYYNSYGYSGYWPYYSSYGYDDYSPVIYIERDDLHETTETKENYWHYCRNPEGYYPNVKECPDGWIPVAPLPPTESGILKTPNVSTELNEATEPNASTKQ